MCVLEVESPFILAVDDPTVFVSPRLFSVSRHRTARAGQPVSLGAACFSSVRRCITSLAEATVHYGH